MKTFIDPEKIEALLKKAGSAGRREQKEVIEKALKLKGLSLEETGVLLAVKDRKITEKLFAAANTIKENIYGKRLVLFAPLYTTNVCANNCLYCAFRKDNPKIKRKTLSLKEIRKEVEIIEAEGHKRILLVAGEDSRSANIRNLEKIIALIYATHRGKGEIRRVNVNVAPLSAGGFRRLKKTGIGTYQLFQETYHYPTYKTVHPDGPKSDYAFRLFAMDRAMEAGINDVGIGALFGLYDYKFEVLALLCHARHLEKKFGAGPHTISVPRIEPAIGAPLSIRPTHAVSDRDFKKLVAILRLAVPYTGLILSTRETARMRNALFGLGISQISAGSRTNPGGYGDKQRDASAQFSLYDHRSTAEVIVDILKLGYIPSFCTACYRLGRTGKDFMDLAKPGLIKNYCLPNSLLTFKEYLKEYGDRSTKELGNKVIQQQIKYLIPTTPHGHQGGVGKRNIKDSASSFYT